MNIIVNIFTSVFGFLTNNSIFEVPLLVWLILPAVITIAVKFIQGKK